MDVHIWDGGRRGAKTIPAAAAAVPAAAMLQRGARVFATVHRKMGDSTKQELFKISENDITEFAPLDEGRGRDIDSNTKTICYNKTIL